MNEIRNPAAPTAVYVLRGQTRPAWDVKLSEVAFLCRHKGVSMEQETFPHVAHRTIFNDIPDIFLHEEDQHLYSTDRLNDISSRLRL